MAFLIVLLGLLIAALGVVGSLRPHLVSGAVLGWRPRARGYVAIGVRVVFGVVLLLGAADSRFPTVFYVLGCIAIVAAVVLAFLGASRTGELVQWWFERPAVLIRIWLLAAIPFGAFLVYAGL